jgi:hypothetical protein
MRFKHLCSCCCQRCCNMCQPSSVGTNSQTLATAGSSAGSRLPVCLLLQEWRNCCNHCSCCVAAEHAVCSNQPAAPTHTT